MNNLFSHLFNFSEHFQSDSPKKKNDIESNTLELYYNTYGNPIYYTPYGLRYMINADATSSGFLYKPIDIFIQNNVTNHISRSK
jgi:hypothetical protein